MSGGSSFYSDIYNHSIEYLSSIKLANFIDLEDHSSQHDPIYIQSEYCTVIEYNINAGEGLLRHVEDLNVFFLVRNYN